MKRKFWGIFLTVLLSVSVFCAGMVAAHAATVLPPAGERIEWASASEWTRDGLTGKIDASTQSVSFVRQFDVSGNKEITLEFKIPVYENDSDTVLDGMSDTDVDISFVNPFTNQFVSMRIGISTGTREAGGCSLYLYDRSNNGWAGYGVNEWIKGTARDNSKFKVGFNLQEYIKVLGADGNYTALTAADGNEAELTAALDAVFKPDGVPCEALKVWISPTAAEANFYVTFTDICGQPLANDGTEIEDIVAPSVPNVKTANAEQTFTAGKAYSLHSGTGAMMPSVPANYMLIPFSISSPATTLPGF